MHFASSLPAYELSELSELSELRAFRFELTSSNLLSEILKRLQVVLERASELLKRSQVLPERASELLNHAYLAPREHCYLLHRRCICCTGASNLLSELLNEALASAARACF